MDEPIYHLALAEDWEAAREDGRYAMSTRGRTLEQEGFIHCSYADQVTETAARFYADVDEVVLLRIDRSLVSSRLVEEGGFPHVYGPIDVDAVIDVLPRPATASPTAG